MFSGIGTIGNFAFFLACSREHEKLFESRRDEEMHWKVRFVERICTWICWLSCVHSTAEANGWPFNRNQLLVEFKIHRVTWIYSALQHLMNKVTKSIWNCTIFRCFLLHKHLKCPSRYVSKIIKMCINLFQLSLLNGGEWTAFSLINICNIYRFFLSQFFLFISFYFFLRFRLGSLIFVNNFYLQFYFLFNINFDDQWNCFLIQWIIRENVFLSRNLRNILAKWIYFVCMSLHHDSTAQTFISIIFQPEFPLHEYLFLRKTLPGFYFFQL